MRMWSNFRIEVYGCIAAALVERAGYPSMGHEINPKREKARVIGLIREKELEGG